MIDFGSEKRASRPTSKLPDALPTCGANPAGLAHNPIAPVAFAPAAMVSVHSPWSSSSVSDATLPKIDGVSSSPSIGESAADPEVPGTSSIANSAAPALPEVRAIWISS